MANIGKPFENSVILGAVGLVAILVNTAVITKVGRRRVFITTGLLICAIAQLFTAVAYTRSPGTKSTGQAIVGLAVLYLIGYNVRISLDPANIDPARADALMKTDDREWSQAMLGFREASWPRSVSAPTPSVSLRL